MVKLWYVPGAMVKPRSIARKDLPPLREPWLCFDDGVCLDGSKRLWFIFIQIERQGSQLVAPLSEHHGEFKRNAHIGSAGVDSCSYVLLIHNHRDREATVAPVRNAFVITQEVRAQLRNGLVFALRPVRLGDARPFPQGDWTLHSPNTTSVGIVVSGVS